MEDEVLDAVTDVARWARRMVDEKPKWQAPLYMVLLVGWAFMALVFVVLIFPLMWLKEKLI